MTRSAYLIDGLRTPFGRYRGALSPVRADDMLAHVFAELIKRTGIPTDRLDDVIAGCANQAGEDNRNVARMALLLAGIPVEVPGATINRLCASSMHAFADAARMIILGEADMIIAGGVEHMSRAPLVVGKPPVAWVRGNQTMFDTTIGWRFVNPKMEKMYGTLGMGETAEKVAQKYKVSREAQDEFAYNSQKKTGRAIESGRFSDAEVIPIITGKNKKTGEETVFDTDEHPRPNVTMEGLAKLRPAFAKDGTITAGNASGINDGAVAMLVASEKAITEHNLTPIARYVTSAAAGVEPDFMGMGPVPATKKALANTGLSVEDMDVVELNEAFAAQSIPCIEQLGLDPEKVNPNGGAIALGHPLGASGARIVITLMHEMKLRKSRYGLATMCVGVGQGMTTILEGVS
jgi:3-oxoadipyl-CoA thiolase